MSKVKYYYDSETLSYHKIEPKRGRKLGIFFLSLAGVVLSGFLLLVIYLNLPYIQTPREKALKRELSNMELQYDRLNRRMQMAENVLDELADRDNSIYRVYFEANPIPEEQRKAGFGGVNRYKDLEGYENSDLIINSAKRLARFFCRSSRLLVAPNKTNVMPIHPTAVIPMRPILCGKSLRR